MSDVFIPKGGYGTTSFGSYMPYEEEALKMLKRRYKLVRDKKQGIDEAKEQADKLKGALASYRAAVVDENGKFVGFLGAYNVNALQGTASIVCELKNKRYNIKKVLAAYKSYLSSSIGIKTIEDETDSILDVKPQPEATEHVIKNSSNLTMKPLSPDKKEELRGTFKYPKSGLSHPYAIVGKRGKVRAVIGLTALQGSNKRADLNIYFDPKSKHDTLKMLNSDVFSKYVEFVHGLGVHNVRYTTGVSNKATWSMVSNADFAVYATIPKAFRKGNKVEDLVCFESSTDRKGWKKSMFYYGDSVEVSSLLPKGQKGTPKENVSPIIELGPIEKCDNRKFRLVSPSAFEEQGIEFENILWGLISTMQDRNRFTIPLGDDKYIPQKGNGYGLQKALKGYTYALLDDSNCFAGFVNVLRENAGGLNIEMELGIAPELQGKGLGTKVIDAFCNELFSKGAASVTSSIFAFNEASVRAHKNAGMVKRGVRTDSYYYDGRLCSMIVMAKENPMMKRKTF